MTFDDAFASVLELAHPILSTLGLPATLFAPTAFVSAGQPLAWPGVEHWLETPFAAELRCLSWQQLGVLSEDGWEIERQAPEVGVLPRQRPVCRRLRRRSRRNDPTCSIGRLAVPARVPR